MRSAKEGTARELDGSNSPFSTIGSSAVVENGGIEFRREDRPEAYLF